MLLNKVYIVVKQDNKMIKNIQNIGKIILSLTLSYLLAIVIDRSLFLDNSPQINKQFIASLQETPSRVEVYLSSIPLLFQQDNLQKQIDDYKKKTGAVEVAVSTVEQQKVQDSLAQTTNPAPNALFNYISTGVAASTPDKQGEVVLRLDPQTQKNIEYKRFTRPDGSTLDIMILN